MDRPPFYSGMIWRSFDLGNGFKDSMKGIGRAVQAVLGSSASGVSGLSATAASPANMTINIAAGQIYQWANVDSNTLGSLGSDSTNILQQGYTDPQTLTLNVSALTGTQQQYALIQAQFQQVDAIRTGDPTGGQIAFYNATNPPVPLQGPNGLGGTLNTVRLGSCVLQVVYGTPAAAGSAAPPAATTGWVPLYLILLSANETQINQNQILVAGPAAYSGYAQAPFIAGLLNQHHLGIPGTAPKIDVTKEIQNVVPYPNLPVTNASPPAVGGNITAVPGIPIQVYGIVNPNGNVAGQIGDEYLWTSQNLLFKCTTSGSSSTAVWSLIGSGGAVIDILSFATAYTPIVGNNTYLAHTTGATNPTVNLLSSAAMAGTKHTYKNIGNVALTLQPQAGDGIEGGSNGVAITVQPGDSVTLAPSTSGGLYIVA